jgi:hypothetical protein
MTSGTTLNPMLTPWRISSRYPRFELAQSQLGHVFASEAMTHPRNYYRTRSATMMADWFKGRRLDMVVAAVKKSPLLKLVLGGGPPFGELSRELSLTLSEHFRPEVEELEAELNRDFSACVEVAFRLYCGVSEPATPHSLPIKCTTPKLPYD